MEQFTFNLSLKNNPYQQENYFISTSNNKSFLAVSNFLSSKEFGNFLNVIGEAKSGKTFLTKIWQLKTNAIFISDTKELLDSSNRFVIIDNYDKWDECNLFHAINIVKEKNVLCLLTSQPNFSPQLKDLSSRINAMNCTVIEPPDDELIEVIILSAFSQKAIQVSGEIVSYLKYRLPRNYATINNFINSIDLFCLSKGRKISYLSLKEVLEIFESNEFDLNLLNSNLM